MLKMTWAKMAATMMKAVKMTSQLLTSGLKMILMPSSSQKKKKMIWMKRLRTKLLEFLR